MRVEVVALLVSLTLRAPPPRPEALAEQATRLYRAKDYKRACPIFQQVTALTPDSAPAWNDLALCELRFRRFEEAYAAVARAIALGDLAERKKAYFNLSLLAPGLQAGEDGEGCAPVPAVPGCPRRLFRCNHQEQSGGGHQGARSETMSLGRSEAEARDGGFELQTVNVDLSWTPIPPEGYTGCLEGGTDEQCAVVWIDACKARVATVCKVRSVCDSQVEHNTDFVERIIEEHDLTWPEPEEAPAPPPAGRERADAGAPARSPSGH